MVFLNTNSKATKFVTSYVTVAASTVPHRPLNAPIVVNKGKKTV
ncbi:hypothetical protein BH24ACI3_BH24ACI3_06840 [soil metagenome]